MRYGKGLTVLERKITEKLRKWKSAKDNLVWECGGNRMSGSSLGLIFLSAVPTYKKRGPKSRIKIRLV